MEKINPQTSNSFSNIDDISSLLSSQTNLTPIILQLQQSISRQQMIIVSLLKQQLQQQQQQGIRSPYFEEAQRVVASATLKPDQAHLNNNSPLIQKIATFENSNNINQIENTDSIETTIQHIEDYSFQDLKRKLSTETNISSQDVDSECDKPSLIKEFEQQNRSSNSYKPFKIIRRNDFKLKSREDKLNKDDQSEETY